MHLGIENVSKRYGGGNWALRNFTLQLGPGVLGLLGPNGAGKTTLMSILATITRATEGRVRGTAPIWPRIPTLCARLSAIFRRISASIPT